MKKNNKFRNNGGNSNAYSLNYKFDSISPAGKISGTALDLIKKYNELAKEAHGSGDYIEMEIYRQYAEHYRKIVTEINERKNARIDNAASQEENNSQHAEDNVSSSNTTEVQTSDLAQSVPVSANQPSEQNPENGKNLKITAKKAFKIIEIQPRNNDEDRSDNEVKVKRGGRRKKTPEAPISEPNAAAV